MAVLLGRKNKRELTPKSFAPRSGLGKGEQNREEDVLGLRRGLAGLGLLPRGEAVPEKTLFDGALERAVKALQGKHGLKTDGIIRPKGSTSGILEGLLEKRGEESPTRPRVFTTVAREETGNGQATATNLPQLAQAEQAETGESDADVQPSSKADNRHLLQTVSPVHKPEIRKDRQGDGAFGAPREGGKKHRGVDIIEKLGAQMTSSVTGTVEKIGDMYGDGRFSTVWLRTKDGHSVGMFYVKPGADIKRGSKVEAGKTPIGSMEDRAKDTPDMKNHVHIEIKNGGKNVDPTPWVNQWLK